MCKWLTVNEALDLILDLGSGEDENIETWRSGGGGSNCEYDPDPQESTDEELHDCFNKVIIWNLTLRNVNINTGSDVFQDHIVI